MIKNTEVRPLFFLLEEAFYQGELLVPNFLFSFFCFVRNNVEFSRINTYVKVFISLYCNWLCFRSCSSMISYYTLNVWYIAVIWCELKGYVMNVNVKLYEGKETLLQCNIRIPTHCGPECLCVWLNQNSSLTILNERQQLGNLECRHQDRPGDKHLPLFISDLMVWLPQDLYDVIFPFMWPAVMNASPLCCRAKKTFPLSQVAERVCMYRVSCRFSLISGSLTAFCLFFTHRERN